MTQKFKRLGQISDQILLRDLSRLSELKDQQAGHLSEAEAQLTQIVAERAKLGEGPAQAAEAMAMEAYLAASLRRRAAALAESEAIAPEIEAARLKALRALSRTRALEILCAREARKLQDSAARKEEQTLSSIAAAKAKQARPQKKPSATSRKHSNGDEGRGAPVGR